MPKRDADRVSRVTQPPRPAGQVLYVVLVPFKDLGVMLMNMGKLWQRYQAGDMAYLWNVQDHRVTMYDVESSTIEYVAYIAESFRLYVWFKNSRKGYCYRGISADVFEHFARADSLGSFLAKHIKPNFTFERIA